MKFEEAVCAAISNVKPAKRRLWAVRMLIWSVVLGIVNIALYLLGWIDVEDLILVTLILSWAAITITAWDVVATTDVRAAVEE